MNAPFRILPESASAMAWEVDFLSLVLLGISAVFSVGIGIALVYFIARYWHTREVNRESTQSLAMHWFVELTWSLGPLAILLFVFTWGAIVFIESRRPPNNPLEVYVVGKQWMWKVAHENGRREINSLHMPNDRPVRLTMISEDVIHSFFVPAFRMKQDVLPGRYTSIWFEPTEPGTYHLFCAEYCGTEHSQMVGSVVVQTPEQYAQWVAQDDPQPMSQRGRRLVESMGCLQCHGVINGAQDGPPLTGLYGHVVPLQDGTTKIADDAYIRRAILEPQTNVRAGFQAMMPSYAGKLQPDQIMEITTYLREIAEATGPLAGPDPQLPPQEKEEPAAEDEPAEEANQ